MRLQLARPGLSSCRRTFNRLFTVHGTTMVSSGDSDRLRFANYLVPLMIGARDLAFPPERVSASDLPVRGALLYFSFVGGAVSTARAPRPPSLVRICALSERPSAGNATDY